MRAYAPRRMRVGRNRINMRYYIDRAGLCCVILFVGGEALLLLIVPFRLPLPSHETARCSLIWLGHLCHRMAPCFEDGEAVRPADFLPHVEAQIAILSVACIAVFFEQGNSWRDRVRYTGAAGWPMSN
jgi:hypothetical protein